MNEKLKEFNVEFLFKAILKLENMDECYKFFEDLCTVQELKALAQRLQVAKMLSENKVYSKYRHHQPGQPVSSLRLRRLFSGF